MKKILVLAGGPDQNDLIINLKNRGYFTILVDYFDNPIAKQNADLHIKESTLDKEKVLEIAKKNKVDSIITACTDQALVTVAYVADKLDFQTQFTYEQVLLFTNKVFMKKMMWENEIPTSKFIFIKSVYDDISMLNFPLMVKPADCNGSFGVKKVHNKTEFTKYFNEAKKISRSGMVIVEEYIEGEEICIDCYVQNNEVNILLTGNINKFQINDNTSIIIQSIFPSNISSIIKEKIKIIANQIVKVFKLYNTPLLIQTIVSDNNVNVIEFAPRIGGGAKHRTIKKITGFDILDANIESCLGKSPNIKSNIPSMVYSRLHLYMNPSIFQKVEGIEKLIENHMIDEFVLNKTEGMKIDSILASRDRVGSIFLKGQNVVDIKFKINTVLDTIKILDINGKDNMRKDIYNNFLQ